MGPENFVSPDLATGLTGVKTRTERMPGAVEGADSQTLLKWYKRIKRHEQRNLQTIRFDI